MRLFSSIFHNLHQLSKIAVCIGAIYMTGMDILAIIAYPLAPTADDYFYAMATYRGALAAAPVCLSSSVCAGLLGDLMLRPHSSHDSFFSGRIVSQNHGRCMNIHDSAGKSCVLCR